MLFLPPSVGTKAKKEEPRVIPLEPRKRIFQEPGTIKNFQEPEPIYIVGRFPDEK